LKIVGPILVLLLLLVVIVAVSFFAKKRGRSFWLWFVVQTIIVFIVPTLVIGVSGGDGIVAKVLVIAALSTPIFIFFAHRYVSKAKRVVVAEITINDQSTRHEQDDSRLNQHLIEGSKKSTSGKELIVKKNKLHDEKQIDGLAFKVDNPDGEIKSRLDNQQEDRNFPASVADVVLEFQKKYQASGLLKDRSYIESVSLINPYYYLKKILRKDFRFAMCNVVLVNEKSISIRRTFAAKGNISKLKDFVLDENDCWIFLEIGLHKLNIKQGNLYLFNEKISTFLPLKDPNNLEELISCLRQPSKIAYDQWKENERLRKETEKDGIRRQQEWMAEKNRVEREQEQERIAKKIKIDQEWIAKENKRIQEEEENRIQEIKIQLKKKLGDNFNKFYDAYLADLKKSIGSNSLGIIGAEIQHNCVRLYNHLEQRVQTAVGLWMQISGYTSSFNTNQGRLVDDKRENSKKCQWMFGQLKHQISIIDQLLSSALVMCDAAIDGDKVGFYTQYDIFERSGVFHSDWQKTVLIKLGSINEGINDIKSSIDGLSNNLMTIDDNITALRVEQIKCTKKLIEQYQENSPAITIPAPSKSLVQIASPLLVGYAGYKLGRAMFGPK
jgi:hypothetical protein